MDTVLDIVTYGLIIIGTFMLWAATLGKGSQKGRAPMWAAAYLLAGFGLALIRFGGNGTGKPLVVAMLSFVIISVVFGKKT